MPDVANLCRRCHEKDAAKPPNFPQVATAEHSGGVLCNSAIADCRSLKSSFARRCASDAVDTMRADGFTHATWWLPSTADELRGWLQDMGWAPDGVHAAAEGPAGQLKLVRLHTDISAT